MGGVMGCRRVIWGHLFSHRHRHLYWSVDSCSPEARSKGEHRGGAGRDGAGRGAEEYKMVDDCQILTLVSLRFTIPWAVRDQVLGVSAGHLAAGPGEEGS
ncbi:hypothetical protein E2C01_056689 [Portunus trituberculatus]|uniref:Uncharacterized protein n=1 Tax=Portunus trituberculatus TaxID=210409 RepID=A0A5B7GUU3_PORTR|nr:hypothetical protein [Portunus trituberculatus]